MTSSLGRVPINALSRGVASERRELRGAVSRVIDSGWYVLGPETEAFEREFADFVGVGHCIGVGNGTDALEIALLALGVQAGDTVATVANAGGYATTAIGKVGARPLFVDVEPDTMLMTAGTLHAALDRHGLTVSAVVVTHLFGQMADMAALTTLCTSLDIPLLEDCAQAAGARCDTGMAGALADVGTYSFYPTKNLGALGDGGAVVTDDAALAGRVRQLRQYGWARKYHTELPGGRNSRLDEIQAAVLRLRLPSVRTHNATRRSVVARYRDALRGPRRFVLSAIDDAYSAHLAVISTPTRDADRAHLEADGIATDIHYPVPDHRQAACAPAAVGLLDVTDEAAGQILTVPCFPQLTDTEIERVCAALRTMP